MTDSLMGELLCLFLLILINGRIFFSSHKNSITIAALSPVVVLVSIFQILAQGITFFELLIFVLSALTFIFNIHALSRFVSHLYVDRYRIGFFLFSLAGLICSVVLTAAAVYFREVPVKAENFNVIETRELISGINGVLWTYENKTENSASGEKPVILFCADKRSDTHRYRPYLMLLAKAGYKIYAFDSFVPETSTISKVVDNPVSRRFLLQYYSFFKPEKFAKLENSYTENLLYEYKILRETALERNGEETLLFLAGDEMQEKALEKLAYMKNSIGTFNISTVNLYETKGFGCVCQTAPLLAFYLNQKRENSLMVPENMVLQTEYSVEKAQKSLQNK